jgi:hypothetical protein
VNVVAVVDVVGVVFVVDEAGALVESGGDVESVELVSGSVEVEVATGEEPSL